MKQKAVRTCPYGKGPITVRSTIPLRTDDEYNPIRGKVETSAIWGSKNSKGKNFDHSTHLTKAVKRHDLQPKDYAVL